MTNVEAKASIKYLINAYELEYRETAMLIKPSDYEAFKLAIKALEAQPTRVDETYLSVKDAISELKAMREHIVGYMSVVGTTAYDMGIEALEAQPCIEDYPTCTECEHYDSEKHYCPRFCQVIKDTLAEAQPCEDCISREEMLLLQTEYAEKMSATTFWKLRDDIRKLPSVKPKCTKRTSGCSIRMGERWR